MIVECPRCGKQKHWPDLDYSRQHIKPFPYCCNKCHDEDQFNWPEKLKELEMEIVKLRRDMDWLKKNPPIQ